MDTLQENLNNYMSDVTVLEDVRWLRKKIENLGLEVERLKRADGEFNQDSGNKLLASLDLGKYLEVEVFTEFNKRYDREVNNIYDRILDIEKELEVFDEELQKKCSDADMKNLEGFSVKSDFEEQTGRKQNQRVEDVWTQD